MIALKEVVLTGEYGRELYTAPFIWVKAEDINIYTNNKGKLAVKETFYVEKIKIQDKKITCLSIKTNKGKRVFVYTEMELKND